MSKKKVEGSPSAGKDNSKSEKEVRSERPKSKRQKPHNTPRTEQEAGGDGSTNTGVAKELKQRHKEKAKKERFLTSRMWFSTLISKLFMDRGTIPENIGNNVLVTNNVYTTKNHISALIIIGEFSENTPICWTSDIIQVVKDQTEGVVIDITFKGARHYPDITANGVRSRERSWQNTLNNPDMPDEYLRRSARCLYSLDVARTGVNLYKMRCYIKIRAKNGAMLRKGIQACSIYLTQIGAKFKRIQSNLDEHLAYVTLMSDKKPEHLKDVQACIFSLQTLAESLPSTQGLNDRKGELMGYDNKSGYPYIVDFRSTAAAKNIMIEALSGWGKTFMASYWLYPFYANGYNLAIMDIKGTEFAAITKALHGITLSMRNSSTKYINTFRWSKDEVFDGDYTTYAHERLRLSKAKMLVICDLPEKLESRAEALFEEFLQFVYARIGVIDTNYNTWLRTENLTPYLIFDMFERFLSNEMRVKYSDVAFTCLERLRIYMSRNGSKSHVFRDAYNYLDILETQCLTFDFGILESSTDNDRVLFHLHVMDMTTINDEFVSHKKRKHEWTVKLLEESQIVDDWLTRVYTREMTLRRAQNQVTILLGNSVAALASNPLSAPMIENINILCLGSINKKSRTYLLDEFGLKPSEIELLEDIQTNPSMSNKFLLVNRMESESTTALLEARVPEEVCQSPLFKVVDTE